MYVLYCTCTLIPSILPLREQLRFSDSSSKYAALLDRKGLVLQRYHFYSVLLQQVEPSRVRVLERSWYIIPHA